MQSSCQLPSFTKSASGASCAAAGAAGAAGAGSGCGAGAAGVVGAGVAMGADGFTGAAALEPAIATGEVGAAGMGVGEVGVGDWAAALGAVLGPVAAEVVAPAGVAALSEAHANSKNMPPASAAACCNRKLVFVIAASSVPWLLPLALRKKGRGVNATSRRVGPALRWTLAVTTILGHAGGLLETIGSTSRETRRPGVTADTPDCIGSTIVQRLLAERNDVPSRDGLHARCPNTRAPMEVCRGRCVACALLQSAAGAVAGTR